MTRKKFFELLSEYMYQDDNKWVFSSAGTIRTTRKDDHDNTYCPITFLCKKMVDRHYVTSNYEDAAKDLGLNLHVAQDIANGADWGGKKSKVSYNKLCRILLNKDRVA